MAERDAQPDGAARGSASPGALAAPWALTPAEVIASLDSRPAGLTTAEATARLKVHGRNELAPPAGPSAVALAFEQFRNPLIYILLVAVAVTVAIGEYLDATAIAVVLLFNAAIGFVQEYRAEQALEALRRLAPRRSLVTRDGTVIELDAAELVPGDIVSIEPGMAIPADARLLKATSLEVDQSVVTGESQAVTKDIEPIDLESGMSDRTNMVVAGCTVTRGHARAVVTATGQTTLRRYS